MKKDQILGLDIGTSAVKATICDTRGNFVAQASRDHQLSSPQPGWAEEVPEDWWQNVIAAILECLSHPEVDAGRIAAVGVAGMVPAVILLDENGRVLRPSIQQNDARAIAEMEEFQRRIPPENFFRLTGANLSQQSVGPKLVWIQRHEPECWKAASVVLGSYDYINFCLTGSLSTEQNWALESGLYDLEKRDWSDELLGSFRVSRSLLPAVRQPTDRIGPVITEAAAATGLAAGTPVVAGSADHVAAALAAGVSEDGDLLVKFGSAGDILYNTDSFLVDPRLYIDYHDIPGKYLLNGCMASSGSLLKWFVQQFCQEDIREASEKGQDIYAYLDGRAAQIPAGSGGVVVLPYFLGEKTPLLDPYARGTFFGLMLHHTRDHLYRAVLEAVVFGFKHHVEILLERGLDIRRVMVSEGGARSPLWRQITADALNLPVAYLAKNPNASFAAAFLAGIGVGAFQSWSELEKFIRVDSISTPDPANREAYEHNYAIYRQIYRDLKDTFRNLAMSGSRQV